MASCGECNACSTGMPGDCSQVGNFSNAAVPGGVSPNWDRMGMHCGTNVPPGCVFPFMFENEADIAVGDEISYTFAPFQPLILIGAMSPNSIALPFGTARITDIQFQETSVLPKQSTKDAENVADWFADFNQMTYEAIRSKASPWFSGIPMADNTNPASVLVRNDSSAVILAGTAPLMMYAWNPNPVQLKALADGSTYFPELKKAMHDLVSKQAPMIVNGLQRQQARPAVP